MTNKLKLALFASFVLLLSASFAHAQSYGAGGGGSGGGGGITFTDGTNTVTGVTTLTVSGGTVGGTSPDATLTISGGGSGCTVSGGAGVVLNNGSSGCATDTDAQLSSGALTLGASGTLGSVTMGNATSGTIKVETVTGALGTSTLLLPVPTGGSDTVALLNTAETFGSQVIQIAGSSTGVSILESAFASSSSGYVVFPALSTADLLAYGTFTNTDFCVATGNTGEVNCATGSTGTGSVVLATSPTISGLTVTSSLTATGLVTLGDLATQAANTVLVNATSGTASPTAQSVSSCSAAGDALIWTTNTGFGCNTSITASSIPFSGVTGATNTAALMMGSTGTFAYGNTALPSQAAGTLGIAGEASTPTLGANGEGDIFLNSTTGGVTIIGKASSTDFQVLNSGGSQVLGVPTGTTNLNIVGTANLGTGSTDYVQGSGGSSGATINTNGGTLTLEANSVANILLPSASGTAIQIGQSNTDYLTVLGSSASGVTLNTSGGALTVTPATTFSNTITTAGGSISSTLDTQPAFVPTASSCTSSTNEIFLPSSATVGVCGNGNILAEFESDGSLPVTRLGGGSGPLNGSDILSVANGTGVSATSSVTLRNGTSNSSAAEVLYIGNNTSSTYVSMTLNSSTNTNGNGDNSFTINATGGLWLAGGTTNGFEINTSGVDFLLNQGTSGTITDAVCVTSGGQIVLDTSATVCGLSTARVKDVLGDYDALLRPNGEPDDALAEIMDMDPMVFRRKYDPGAYAQNPNYRAAQIGMLAEDVAAVDPRLTVYEEDGVTPRSWRLDAMISLLVAGVQEQQREFERRGSH